MIDSSEPADLLARAEGLLADGRAADAAQLYDAVAASPGAEPELRFRLGRLAARLGRLKDAISHYRAAISGEPDNARYTAGLGIALQNAGSVQEAYDVLQRALSLDGNEPTALHALGVHFINSGQNRQATALLQKAATLQPDDAQLLANLATALMGSGRHGDALNQSLRAVELAPDGDIEAYTLARVYMETGRLQDAARTLDALLAARPQFAPAYEALTRTRKFSDADAAVIANAETLLDETPADFHRASLHFALGKMQADRGDYENAFSHYESANRIQSRGYDHRAELDRAAAIKATFGEAFLERYAGLGSDSERPVFIVGMPRSGTTLMEQIIAAHPDAAGAGELYVMSRIAETVLANPGEAWSTEKTAEYIRIYNGVLGEGRNDAERIVDKMPGNFLYLGLITTLFPNATIIHAVRNPLDTAVSCFLQNFGHLAWTNSLDSIADYYALYRDMMAFWELQFPAGEIVAVEYEKLVSDPEVQSRRLLDACGLDWDPAVLDFHRQASAVSTASIAQVRQPIYRSSQEHWRRYEPFLEPLLAKLDPYLEPGRQPPA